MLFSIFRKCIGVSAINGMIAVFLISAPLPLQAAKLTSENEGRLEKVRDGP
jgi:hypothetical protein